MKTHGGYLHRSLIVQSKSLYPFVISKDALAVLRAVARPKSARICVTEGLPSEATEQSAFSNTGSQPAEAGP